MNKQYLETIKIVDGKIFHLQWHQLRVDSVFKKQGVFAAHILNDLIKPPLKGSYRCRIIYDMHFINIEYILYKKKSIQKLKLVYDETINYMFKYANRENLEKLLEQREICDEVLIVKNSHITDITIANVALFDGKAWYTPKSPLLHGTTRARLLHEKKLFEKDIKVEDLFRYKKLALMNAMRDFDIIAQENIREIIC